MKTPDPRKGLQGDAEWYYSHEILEQSNSNNSLLFQSKKKSEVLPLGKNKKQYQLMGFSFSCFLF